MMHPLNMREGGEACMTDTDAWQIEGKRGGNPHAELFTFEERQAVSRPFEFLAVDADRDRRGTAKLGRRGDLTNDQPSPSMHLDFSELREGFGLSFRHYRFPN